MGILEKSHRICIHFLWSGSKEASVSPWVSWEKIVRPKSLGGWGLKNIFLFAKALETKWGSHLIHLKNLWTRVMIEKYIAPDSVVDWIKNSQKGHKGGSVIWKAVNKSFVVLEDNNDEERNHIVPVEKTTLWHQRLRHIEQKDFEHYMVNVW